MAVSAARLDIYNMALGFIGTRSLGSPNENTPEAIRCNQYWDRARRSALRDFPYNFAQKRVQLAGKALPDVYEGQWAYAYAWPSSALKILRVHAPGRESGARRQFVVRSNGSENLILTNVENAQAEITIDVERTDLWDELFVVALARKLACMIAVSLLKNNPQKVQELEQLYAMALPDAQAHSASEEEVKEPLDSWIAARGHW